MSSLTDQNKELAIISRITVGTILQSTEEKPLLEGILAAKGVTHHWMNMVTRHKRSNHHQKFNEKFDLSVWPRFHTEGTENNYNYLQGSLLIQTGF